MNPFPSILVPLDGSPLGESVIPFVQDLAKSLHASLLLLDVVVPTPELSATFLPYSTSILEELRVGAEKYIEGVGKRIGASGVAVETTAVVGQAAEAILDAAKQTSADLIALSTHGRSGPARWILGSVADAVIRHADRPCLVIPARGADRGKARLVDQALLARIEAQDGVALVAPDILRVRSGGGNDGGAATGSHGTAC